MTNAVILLLAGQSSRMEGQIVDKGLIPIHNKPLFCYSLEAFLETELIDMFIIVSRNESQTIALKHAFQNYDLPEAAVLFTQGGNRRQDSVHNGLKALPDSTFHVFVHDCARPLINANNITQLYKAVTKDKAAALVHRVTDTIKQVESLNLTCCNLKSLERDTLLAMETPQAAEKLLLQQAYQFVSDKNLIATDETSAISYLGHPISLIENKHPNPKLTYPQDIAYIEFLLEQQSVKHL